MTETSKYKPPENKEVKQVNVGKLDDFDMDYFKSLEGDGGWIALGMENCKNQHYFIVYSDSGEKIGIIGVYDTDDDKNISHTVVDPKYRGQGLAGKFKDLLMDKLALPFITLTIDLDNKSSIKATEKMAGIKKVSDDDYEKEFHKVKYRFEKL